MPLYSFRFLGCTIYRDFHRGQVPKAVGPFGLFKRVLTFPDHVFFAGGRDGGWSRNQLSDQRDYSVTWGVVEKHMKHCAQAAREKTKRDFKHLKTFIGDLL